MYVCDNLSKANFLEKKIQFFSTYQNTDNLLHNYCRYNKLKYGSPNGSFWAVYRPWVNLIRKWTEMDHEIFIYFHFNYFI